MTRIAASAPGKLVLLGDYAVLDGAPALAVAVNRRARVVLETRDDNTIEIAAPDLGIAAAHARLDADGGLCWSSAADAERLGLVAGLWQALADAAMAPRTGMHLHLDTVGFFETREGERRKLGLGSSAALSVALVAALLRAGGHEFDASSTWLARLLAWHSAWQGGRGSGVDLAASLAGGLIVYRRGDESSPPTMRPANWPPAGAPMVFVWSGQSVSTGGYLARLDAWKQAHAADYAARLGELRALAESMPTALAGSAADFVALVAAYGASLQRLAEASGLEIFSPAQRVTAQLAAREGAAFKPCGAGGDLGIVVADAAPQLERVRRAMMAAGLHVEGLAVDPLGVQCEVVPTR